MLPRYEVVVLDVDGTLVDSNDAHAYAWVDALAEQGIGVEFDEVRRLIGKGGDKLLPEVTGIEEDDPRGEKLSDRRAEIFERQFLPRLRAFPEVRALLTELRRRQLRLVVATSARSDEVNRLLDVAGVRDLMDAKTSSDDAEKSKPDPDIVAAAVKRARIPPSRAIMIGDTPYDVTAAKSAHVDCIAFRCGGWSDGDLRGAVAIYDDAADLLRQLDSSPLFAPVERRTLP